jgi:hypothetical protein
VKGLAAVAGGGSDMYAATHHVPTRLYVNATGGRDGGVRDDGGELRRNALPFPSLPFPSLVSGSLVGCFLPSFYRRSLILWLR